MLQSGTFENLILQLENLGFFTYVLPFLVIFSLVFGILSNVKMFKENKGVTAILALSIGLLALWQGIVPQFFAEIFPRMGVALSVLVVALILVGIFVPMAEHGKKGWGNYIFLGVGGLGFLIALLKSAEAYSWYSGGWFTENMAMIIVGIILLGAIIAAIASQTRTAT